MRSLKDLSPLAIIFFTALLILGVRLLVRPTPAPAVLKTVIVREGLTVDEIDKLLADEGIIPLRSLPESLEGYLFPDTYEFFVPQSPATVLHKFTDNFDRRVRSIVPEGTDLKKIITVASLIEKEAPDSYDRRIISGIIWKRLTANIPLQIDSSICYIKDGQGCLPITDDDYKIDSPYNTYLYKGLPPGPIGNPGKDSIEASLYPEKSPYLFYLTNPKDRKTVFATNFEEHKRNIIKYLR
ncbi:MAG: endolytic transglycosylase MltG [Candidatus Colwellbacteria bacterium]|nr:endolytic transglycosylase MltG [Candidatus Colwellbacteria bacterium]